MSDEIAAIIAWRDATGTLLRAKVYAADCTQLLAGAHVDSSRVSCAASGPRVPDPKEPLFVELALEGRKGKGSRMERVSVVVVGLDERAKAQNAIAAIAKDGETCVRIARSSRDFAEQFDGYICIDKIYRDHGYAGKCDANSNNWAVSAADVNPRGCEVVEFPVTNDFGDNCTNDESDDEPKCRGNARPLRVEAMACGALAVPFNYASIMKNAGTPRYLRGVTPMSRGSAPSTGPIVLPGDEAGVEFLGSMPTEEGDSKNHRKTDIATDGSKGQGLLHITGSVDAVGSAVLLYPRLPVSVRCGADDGDTSNDEACQCFYSTGKSQTDTTKVGCVDKTDKGKVRTCKPLVDAAGKCHEAPSVAAVRYFACEAKTSGAPYGKTGLPCTRPEHCGAYGRCTASAVCVAEDSAVWTPGWTRPTDAKPCTKDGDGSGNGCPEGFRCGLSLFDVAGRTEIVFDLPATGGASDAGMCRDTTTQECDSDDDCPDDEPCIGYQLSAGKHKQK